MGLDVIIILLAALDLLFSLVVCERMEKILVLTNYVSENQPYAFLYFLLFLSVAKVVTACNFHEGFQ